MKYRFAAALGILGAVLASPADAQDRALWSLKFSHDPIDTITVHYKDGSARSFYYFTFTLENASEQDAELSLHVKAVVGSNPRKQRVHVAVPHPDAEETVKRISRTPGLLNINEINRHNAPKDKPGVLKRGESLQGIAVLGTFDREWDVATVTVSGLEPHSVHARVRKVGNSFTLGHAAYHLHNERVLQKAGKDAGSNWVHAIIQHEVVWTMRVRREGDEFEPQLDSILLDWEGWDVVQDPAPKIVLEKRAAFGK
jgi:hypothetical protein